MYPKLLGAWLKLKSPLKGELVIDEASVTVDKTKYDEQVSPYYAASLID
jgi:hypothetical protein